MPQKDKEHHEPEAKKEKDQPIRDLPPKKDAKGGKADEKKQDSGRTGEIDFMQNY